MQKNAAKILSLAITMILKDVTWEVLELITCNLLLGLNLGLNKKRVFQDKIFRTKVRILICCWIGEIIIINS